MPAFPPAFFDMVNQMALNRMQRLIIAKTNPPSVEHAARTAVSAVVSLLVAQVFGLPEAYWSAITTLIVMQSTLGSAVAISAQRFVGTAIGAACGALVGTHFPGNIAVFGLAVFVIGVFCTAVRLERSAYRYASITLAIVMLIARSNSQWIIALHRFCEVSIGIAVGLALAALWPERENRLPQGAA
jgi:uncharacterized membrane protein YccC